MRALKLLVAIAVTAALSVPTMWAPASAETTTAPCTTDPNSTSAVSGDDLCNLDANSMLVLASATDAGPDNADANILGNDGVANVSCWDITSIATNASPDDLYLDLFSDKNGTGQGFCSFTLSLSTAASGTYTFTYTLDDGGTRTVTLNVKPYVPPTVPTVKKVRRPGYIKACNHDVRAMDIYYGSFKQPAPDGSKWVAGKSCKLIRVHRHRIDWVAIVHKTGEYMGTGHVRDIVLPKGDGPSHIPSSRSITSLRTTNSASHWLLARR